MKSTQPSNHLIISAVNVFLHHHSSTPISENINDFIAELGTIIPANRIALFRAHFSARNHPVINCEYEWHDSHTESFIEQKKFVDFEFAEVGFNRWYHTFLKQKTIHSLVKDLPKKEQTLLQQLNVKTVLVVPIFCGKHWWGVLSFDNCESEQLWDVDTIEGIELATQALGILLDASLLTESRNQAIEDLSYSQERVHEALEAAEHGIWDWNMSTNEVYYSPIWANQLGYEQDELTNSLEEWRGRVHPDDLDDVVEKINHHIAGQNDGFKAEFRMHHKSGNWIWVLAHGRIIKWDAEGNPLHLSGTHTDITFHKHLEAELEKQRHLTDAIIQGIPDLLWLKDKDGVYLAANRRFENFFGSPTKDILGKTDYDFVDKELADFFRKHDLKAMHAKVPSRNEERIQFADDGHFEILDTIKTPIEDANHQLIGVLGLGRDITVRKELEQALEAERNLFAGGPVGVLSWDNNQDLTIRYASPNIASILGYQQQELTEQGFHFTTLIHPDDVKHVLATVTTHTEQKELAWEQAYRVMTKSGDIKYLHQYTQLELDADGHPYQLHGYVVDETLRHHNQEKLTLFANAILSSHDGMMICNADNQIIEINPAFTDITGYTAEKIHLKNPSFLSSGRHDKAFYQDLWQEIHETGRWSGELWNRRNSGEYYAAQMNISTIFNEQGELTHYIGVFSDITHQKEEHEKIQHLAHFDALTQLPNRVLLLDRINTALSHSRRTHNPIAVGFLDLDNFKPLNDRYGHALGDKILIKLGKLLCGLLREEDTVGRIGGDEFILLMHDVGHATELYQVLNRLLTELSRPIEVDEKIVTLEASIGVTTSDQTELDADKMLRQADQAMYEAKKQGGNRFHFFDPMLEASLQQKNQAITQIKHALQQDELVLYYQPKISLKTNHIIGFEALIRWEHPEDGLIPPLEFLPLLEDSSTAIEIDFWVLEQAILQHRLWEENGFSTTISVNLCGATLLSENFIEQLSMIANTYPEAARNIELEVLETASFLNLEKASRILNACIDLGFSLALDDFGTGHSSLTYLRHLPIQIVKIDQSFTRELLKNQDDYALVESVVQLSKAFGLTSIAEGVETRLIAEKLLDMGCDLAQGYGISKPLPSEEVLNWVKNWQTD